MDDIKLKSFGSSTTTSKDAGSESVGLDSSCVLFQTGNLVHSYNDILTDPQKWCPAFYGWNSHYNTGSFYKEIVNTPNGRGDALDLVLDAMQKNYRPLFLIYTKAYNKGSNTFNQMIYNWVRGIPPLLGNGSKCQTESFNSSKMNYGFYFLHYQNNADETDTNANIAKAFITQFGQITTGYPWYIVYCKYPDGHVYARYGSLYSMNTSRWDAYSNDADIFKKLKNSIVQFGNEISYVYSEEDPPTDPPDPPDDPPDPPDNPPDDPPVEGEYYWKSEKALIKLGQPYLFTERYYNYCKTHHAPIAVIYYDTKTSTPSKELYVAAFSSKENVKALYHKLSSYKVQNPQTDKFNGGYCCFMVLDRCGNISSPNTDQQFFAREFPTSDNIPFAVLAVYYDGKTYCYSLPAVTSVDQLAEEIYKKCESGNGGVGKFSEWPGRQAWLNHQPKKPDLEVKPDKSGQANLDSSITSIGVPPYWEDPTAKKKYSDYDSDYSGNFTGIKKISNRPEVTWMLNLADVSTPETTYYLIGSYDMKSPSNCPWHIDSLLTDYVNSDNKFWTKNLECKHGKFKELYEKGKKYRFFIFYEFSHGHYRSISIGGITYDYIWDHFTSLATTQRVWGMFDSCHSGSMIVKSDVTPHSAATQFAVAKSKNRTSQKELPEGIFGYLDRKFSRRKALLSTVANRQAALTATNNEPRLTLWSSTGTNSYGWYWPGSSTNFTVGIARAFAATYWDAGSRKYPYRQIRYGWAGARDDTSDYTYANGGQTGEQAFKKVQGSGKEKHNDTILETCIPQCRNYPQYASPETTILFY